MKLTFRVRVAILTGLVIVLTGAGLLALNYALVRNSLRQSIGTVFDFPTDIPGIDIPGTPTHPPNATEPLDEVTAAHLAGLPQEVERVTLQEVVTQSAIALGVMSMVAVGLSWFMAGRFLRPIRDLTKTAQQLSESTLDQRIASGGPPDEITELAATFNAMLDRLERAFAAQRRFVANASHELRTPVTISRTAVDVLDAKAAPTPEQVKATIDKVRHASLRSEALIDGLLVLARTETELTNRVQLDLAAIAESVVGELQPQFRARSLRIERHLERALVTGDPVLVELLVTNLVENAVKHNEPRGWIGLTSTSTDSGSAKLIVANTGDIVDPADADGLFEAFRRGGGDRMASASSTGLGLSIVRSIAKAHGGTVRLDARPGGGLVVTVEFRADGPAIG